MANSLEQSGAQSATFVVPTIESEGTQNGFLSVVDWAALPSGKLKELLNKQYRSGTPLAPNFSLFFDAAAKAGFSCSTLHRNGSSGTSAHNDFLTFELDAQGYPIATIVTADIGPYIARLEASYSASE